MDEMIPGQQAIETPESGVDQLATGTPAPIDPNNPVARSMRKHYKDVMHYDNKPTIDVVRNAAKRSGIDPSLLFSSAFQEGMSLSLTNPDDVSEAYVNAEKKGFDSKTYPVDGFYNYGVDTFGDRYKDLAKKGYLPKGFEQQFKTYPALNEIEERKKAKGLPYKFVNTAAFKTNEDALVAKSALLRDEMDTVNSYAKKKGIKLDDDAKNYFTMSSYNGGWGNAKIMLDEYASAKDKSKFIKEGQTTRKGVDKNIQPRMANMKLATELLNEQK